MFYRFHSASFDSRTIQKCVGFHTWSMLASVPCAFEESVFCCVQSSPNVCWVRLFDGVGQVFHLFPVFLSPYPVTERSVENL